MAGSAVHANHGGGNKGNTADATNEHSNVIAGEQLSEQDLSAIADKAGMESFENWAPDKLQEMIDDGDVNANASLSDPKIQQLVLDSYEVAIAEKAIPDIAKMGDGGRNKLTAQVIKAAMNNDTETLETMMAQYGGENSGLEAEDLAAVVMSAVGNHDAGNHDDNALHDATANSKDKNGNNNLTFTGNHWFHATLDDAGNVKTGLGADNKNNQANITKGIGFLSS
jgi:hypothetical protein